MSIPQILFPSCELGESVKVRIKRIEGEENFSFDFPVVIKKKSKNNSFDIYLDTSGSLSIDKILEAKKRFVSLGQNIIESRNEKWLQWLSSSFSRGKSAIIIINESEGYGWGDTSAFHIHLNRLNLQLRNLVSPISGKLMIIADNPGSSQLIVQWNKASGILSKYNIDSDTVFDIDYLLIEKTIISRGNEISILSLPSWTRSSIDFFKRLGFLKIADLAENLFSREIVNRKSKSEIKIEMWCGEEECPPGCCKVCKPDGTYCCVKL
ncbi:MAG TPA: hypothetical protein DEP38_15335 [Cyanobacteria bacterium UBA9226]|nr:hypothetical protein [Cyanobacteria bacterium UBA9226]